VYPTFGTMAVVRRSGIDAADLGGNFARPAEIQPTFVGVVTPLDHTVDEAIPSTAINAGKPRGTGSV
jgi:hypothetical protein